MIHTTRWLVLGCIGSSALAAGGLLEACGGDNGTGDGGPDATSDVSTDGAPGDASTDNNVMDSTTGCPTYNGSTAFCKAAVTECNTCNLGSTLTACAQAHFTQTCEGYGGIVSQAFDNAITSCDMMCGDASTACIQAELADASLSTAQKKVVTDYCAKCSDGGASCGGSLSQFLVQYSDNIATEVDNFCIPDASSQCPTALFCVLAVLQSNLPADPCKDAAAD